MIVLNMDNKAETVTIKNHNFTLENDILLLEIDCGDYNLTDKVITAAFSPAEVETGALSVVNNIIQLPIYSSEVMTGLNLIQINFRWDTNKLEQSPIMQWIVNASVPTTKPAQEDIDIITYLISQVQAAGKIDINGLNSNVQNLNFKHDTSYPPAVGEVGWNLEEGTLDLGLLHGSTLQIGQETLYPVINSTGLDISNGTVVMFDGTVGATGRIKIKPAIAETFTKGEMVLGVTTGIILNGEHGYVTHFGKARNIDLTGGVEEWIDGDILWLSSTVPGKMTKYKPEAPHVKVMIGVIISAKTNGTLFVRPMYGSELGGTDSNVHITNPQDGDILVYNSNLKRWENKPQS